MKEQNQIEGAGIGAFDYSRIAPPPEFIDGVWNSDGWARIFCKDEFNHDFPSENNGWTRVCGTQGMGLLQTETRPTWWDPQYDNSISRNHGVNFTALDENDWEIHSFMDPYPIKRQSCHRDYELDEGEEFCEP